MLVMQPYEKYKTKWGFLKKRTTWIYPLNRNYKIQDLLNNNNKNILINQREDNP